MTHSAIESLWYLTSSSKEIMSILFLPLVKNSIIAQLLSFVTLALIKFIYRISGLEAIKMLRGKMFLGLTPWRDTLDQTLSWSKKNPCRSSSGKLHGKTSGPWHTQPFGKEENLLDSAFMIWSENYPKMIKTLNKGSGTNLGNMF